MIIKKASKWDKILEKPSTYPPSPHQHGDFDLLGIDWSKVQNKPSAFPPESHTHDASEILNLPAGKVETIYSNYISAGGSSVNIDLTEVTDLSGLFIFIVTAKNSASDDYGGSLLLYPNGNAYTDTISVTYISGGTIAGTTDSVAGKSPWSDDAFYIGMASGSRWSTMLTFYKPHTFAFMTGRDNYYYSSPSYTIHERVSSADPNAIELTNLGVLRIDPNHRSYTFYIYLTILHIKE